MPKGVLSLKFGGLYGGNLLRARANINRVPTYVVTLGLILLRGFVQYYCNFPPRTVGSAVC